jgi:hypothetical protein
MSILELNSILGPKDTSGIKDSSISDNNTSLGPKPNQARGESLDTKTSDLDPQESVKSKVSLDTLKSSLAAPESTVETKQKQVTSQFAPVPPIKVTTLPVDSNDSLFSNNSTR